MKHPYPSNIHIPFVTGVTNDNSSLTEKNILKIEAELSALESYVDCEFSALTSKIDIFSDSMKTFSQISIIKNTKTVKVKFVRKILHYCRTKKKSKATFIESLLETQTTVQSTYPAKCPNSFNR